MFLTFLFSEKEILKDGDEIVTVKRDRGNGIVILDKIEMDDIIHVSTKFRRLDNVRSVVLLRENKMKNCKYIH